MKKYLHGSRKWVAAGLALLAVAACSEKKKTVERPHNPWVFRSVLDQKPRIVTAALSDEIWVAYDARTSSLYKAWKGGVNFDGAVYTTVHGPQPTSKGYAYYTDAAEDNEWLVISSDQTLTPEIQWRGHRIEAGQVTFRTELRLPDGTIITVKEKPEALKRGSQTGLQRTFWVENAGTLKVGLQLKVASLINERDFSTTGVLEDMATEVVEFSGGSVMSLSGKLILNSDKATDVKAYFHKGFDLERPEAAGEPKEEEALAGAGLIERSDCHSCHNEQVQTVGPAYIAIARRYPDNADAIAMLAGKVINGGSGVWGEAMMTPHPTLSEGDAKEMVRYILSLDDNDANRNAKAWHLGEKTVPFRLTQEIPKITAEQPGLAVYLYLYSGDQPNMEVLKAEKPIRAAITSQLHVRQVMDMPDMPSKFALRIKGNLRIAKTGSYSLRLVSDDGARLYVDGKQAIDNWGLHGATPRDGEVYLTAGDHPLEIEFFEAGGGGSISLQWFNKEKAQFELIPESMLFVSPKDYEETRVYIPEGKLVKAIPGDRQWLDAVHPAFDLFQARPDDFKPRVGGIDFLSEEEMLVCTWDSMGPVYLVKNYLSGDPAQMSVQLIASGLAEPLGIKVVDGDIYVLQKQELTRLIDHDGDKVIDEYETVSDDWLVSANFHEFAFGLVYKDGYFYGALATAILPGGASAQPQIPDRGKIVKISKATGETTFIASGLRTPNGIGIGVDGEIFIADNQGDWLPASKINHVREGAWYGSRSVDPVGTKDLVQDEPLVWLPQDEIGNSPSTPLYLDKGPYAGQMIHCEVTHGGIKRVFVEKVNNNYQGAVFRFSQGLEAGVNRLAWAPDGSLIVGGIGVSGNWGQTGKLHYGLQRLVYNQKSVFEMLKVSVRSNGFEVEFTEPIKEGQNVSASDFLIQRFYLLPTADYGGPKLGVTDMKPKSFNLSADRKKIFFELDGLKEKHMFYFRAINPFVSEKDQELWTTEAWYTLTNIPVDMPGFTSPSAPAHNQLTPAEMAAGWKLLFDGKSTTGIRNYNAQTLGKKWVVQDGALHFAGKGSDAGWQAKDGGDVVITDKEYENYELYLEWKTSEGGNSGIIFNVTESPENEYAWHTGMEMQVLDNVSHPDGQIEKHRAGDLYDLIATRFVTVNPPGEWNRARLVIKNGHLEQWLNGYKLVETDLWTPEWEALVAGSKFKDMPAFAKSKKGHIVLQDHGDKVWFRNIKIREL